MKSRWRYVNCSEPGTSHLASGVPCQDENCCNIIELSDNAEEILVVVASDGAGSAPFSKIGAELACDSLRRAIENHLVSNGNIDGLTEEFFKSWISSFHNLIADEAYARAAVPRDFACTLIAAIAGESKAVFAQLGDGAIVVRSHVDSDFSIVFWPEKGEFANSTFFLTQPDAQELIQHRVEPWAVSELAAFTDGIERLALSFATRKVHGPFFNSVFHPLRLSKEIGQVSTLQSDLASLLSSPAVNARTDDDKTLVLACRDQLDEWVTTSATTTDLGTSP